MQKALITSLLGVKYLNVEEYLKTLAIEASVPVSDKLI